MDHQDYNRYYHDNSYGSRHYADYGGYGGHHYSTPNSWIFTAVCYVAGYVCVLSALLSVGIGLVTLCETMEEYPTLTRKVLRYIIFAQFGVHVLLWLVDGFPIWIVALGIVAHALYLLLLKRYPEVHLTSPPFIGSCIAMVVSAYFWSSHLRSIHYEMSEIGLFLFVCVLAVPGLLVLSLNVEHTVLPYAAGDSAGGLGLHVPSGRFNFKKLAQSLKDSVYRIMGKPVDSSSHDTQRSFAAHQEKDV